MPNELSRLLVTMFLRNAIGNDTLIVFSISRHINPLSKYRILPGRLNPSLEPIQFGTEEGAIPTVIFSPNVVINVND